MAREEDNPYRLDYQDRFPLESEYTLGGEIVYYADGNEEIIHVNQLKVYSMKYGRDAGAHGRL